MTKVEEKKYIKALRKRIKDGDELDDEEHEFAIEHDLIQGVSISFIVFGHLVRPNASACS